MRNDERFGKWGGITMVAKAVRVQIIELPVRNVKRSAEWYTEWFGFGYYFPFKEGDEAAWLNVNGMALGLVRSQAYPLRGFAGVDGSEKPAFTLQVDNIQELHAAMAQRDVIVHELVYKPGGGYSFLFLDPDGNRIGVWGGWPKD
jgi:predicted enzyme related to lactoylglutathione lyase